MKNWVYGLAKYIFREWVMFIPSIKLRLLFLKKTLRSIGKGTFIAMGVDIRGGGKSIDIGEDCVINRNVTLDGRGGRLIIGDTVDIGQETNIWTLGHDPNDKDHSVKGGSVIIEDHVWIATRVTILPNITLGRGCVVASGSVVTKDVPPLMIVAGIPAKVIGRRDNPLTYRLNFRPWFQ